MAEWTRLAVDTRFRGPALYFKFDVSAASSYTILLTDLVYIWAERTDRRGIMRRAMDENTSIDPTNGPDQLKQLLEHIARGLRGTGGSSVAFGATSDKQALKFEVKHELPSPLEPLRWPMTLALEDQTTLASTLLRPALNSLADCQTGLLSIIGEKDKVITKLRDKLEVSGIDMAAVFRGAGFGEAQTSPSSKSASQAVPGLGEFDYEAWEREAPHTSANRLTRNEFPQIPAADQSGSTDWWNTASAGPEDIEDRVPDYLPGATSTPSFSLPGHQKRREDDTDSTQSPVNDSPPIFENDGRQEDFATKLTAQDHAGKTEPRKRIGKVGGAPKGQINQSSATEAATETERETILQQPTRPPVKKLGKIGGAPVSKVKEEDEAPEPQRQVSPAVKAGGDNTVEDPRKERETSTERADRRREELKRQMDEKRKTAGPKKKQRKF